MKILRLFGFMTAGFLILSLSNCKETPEEKPNPTPSAGSAKVSFEYVWGMNSESFAMNTLQKHPRTGDSLTFTTFKFYVSNLKFKKNDGSWYMVPESYYLIDAAVNGGSMISLSDLPAGTYTAMEYTLGVDSTRNVSGAQTGALSTTHGMFWSWNSGYIMVKAEGTSPNSATGDFAYHLGGFTGANNVVTTKTTDFGGATLTIGSGTPEVVIQANPARFWHTINGVGATSKIHMPGANAVQAAKDFYDGFVFEHIHN